MRLANNKFTKTLVNNILNETRDKENRTSKKSVIEEIKTILEEKDNIENMSAKASDRI